MAVDDIKVFGMEAIKTSLYAASYPRSRIVKFCASNAPDFSEEEIVMAGEVFADEWGVERLSK